MLGMEERRYGQQLKQKQNHYSEPRNWLEIWKIKQFKQQEKVRILSPMKEVNMQKWIIGETAQVSQIEYFVQINQMITVKITQDIVEKYILMKLSQKWIENEILETHE